MADSNRHRRSSFSMAYPDTAPRDTWRPQLQAWMKKNHPAKLKLIHQAYAVESKPRSMPEPGPDYTRVKSLSDADLDDGLRSGSRSGSGSGSASTASVSSVLGPTGTSESKRRRMSSSTNFVYDAAGREVSTRLPSPPPDDSLSPISSIASPEVVGSGSPLASVGSLVPVGPSPPALTTIAQPQVPAQPQSIAQAQPTAMYANPFSRRCISCGSDQSPCWRPSWSAHEGQLCNSCGLRYKKTGARCLAPECGRIPAKGEWVIMKRNALKRSPDASNLQYTCLTCGSDVELRSHD